MKKLNYLRIGLFLYLLVVGTIGSVYAQKVDSETALDIASSYLRQHRSNRAPARSDDSEKLSIAYTAKEAGETYYYAINNGTDNGFVIVSGHDATQEILGYAEDGHFDYDSIPPQMRWLLGTYEKQIHAMYSDNALANQSRAAKRVAKATRTNISNFVNITWNQYAPYNFGITGGKNSYPIGCVNTATSIIMKYYNHPAQATNPALGTLKIGSTTAKAIEANRKLSFSSMTASYSSSTTSYSGANKAVADLMYLVARLNETDFDTSGSGASPYTSAINMMEYFGYDKTIEYLDREDFTATEWDNLMYAEIAAKRPVLYAGDDTAGKGGHAFLLTGYKDSKYYINWGWGGSSNGFFALNACNASGYKFNDYQYAITHIKKDAGGIPSITINSYDVKTKELGIGQALETSVNYSGHTLKNPIYSWQIKLKNTKTGTIVPLYARLDKSMSTYYEETTFRDTIPTSFVPGEQYEVLLYYHNGNGTWTQFAQTTKPIITIKHQIDFKSYEVKNTELSRGSTSPLAITFYKASSPIPVSYDLCAKITNLTQGTDTLIVLMTDYLPSYSSRDKTYSATIVFSESYHVGDNIKVEAGYRISGKSEWEYIVQQPIELNLAPEMEMFAYNLKESGDLTYGYPLPYTLSYIRRSDLSSKYQIGVKYEGIDTPLDTMYVAYSSFSGSTSQKEYSSTMSLPTFLKLNKNYRMSCKYRVQGEETWTDFAEGNTVNIHVLPAVTFHSFEHNKDELYACARDTMTFEYSKVSSGTSLSYTIGAHLIGQSSGIDTTIVATVNRYYSNFTGSIGEHLSSTITYNLPSTLYVGENVKVQLCWKEPGEAWVPMVKEYKTFKVLNCYELQSYSAEVDTAQIGSNATISVNYRALTSSSSKPTYWLGVKIRNLTTSSTEEYINTNYTLSWNASATDLSKTNVTFTMPSNCNVGDKVEVTALYRVGNMDKWIEVPGDPVIFEMKPPKNGVVLLGSPTVANEGYITPKNYEFHLVFKNYLNKELTRYIDVEIISNGSYKGDISHTFKIGANETKEIIITPNNSTDKILKNLPLNCNYNFRIYNGNNGGYYITSDKCPQLHLIPFGDVTQDGITDLNDVEAVKLHLLNPASYPLDTISKIAADGNADGKVSIADLILIIDTVKE